MTTMHVHLFPGDTAIVRDAFQARINVIKLIRQFTGCCLREAKAAMENHTPFEVSDISWREFVKESCAIGATIVIGKLPTSLVATPVLGDVPVTHAFILTELRDMRREIAGLRKHLGMIAHE